MWYGSNSWESRTSTWEKSLGKSPLSSSKTHNSHSRFSKCCMKRKSTLTTSPKTILLPFCTPMLILLSFGLIWSIWSRSQTNKTRTKLLKSKRRNNFRPRRKNTCPNLSILPEKESVTLHLNKLERLWLCWSEPINRASDHRSSWTWFGAYSTVCYPSTNRKRSPRRKLSSTSEVLWSSAKSPLTLYNSKQRSSKPSPKLSSSSDLRSRPTKNTQQLTNWWLPSWTLLRDWSFIVLFTQKRLMSVDKSSSCLRIWRC